MIDVAKTGNKPGGIMLLFKKKTVSAVLMVFVLLGALGCASMRRGTQAWVILPTSMEVGVGQGVADNVVQQYPAYQNAAVNAYIQGLGAKIAAICDRRDVNYRFTVLDTPVVNAFAAPGGFIFITTGLLANASNEAEVVVVLGHEVGHIVARHGAQQIQAQLGLGLAAELTGLNKSSELFKSMVGLGTNLAIQGYGRENEFEADHYGALYASRLGYDPYAEVTFFEKLKKVEKSSPSALETLLASHPPTADRIKEFEKTKTDLPSLKGALNQAEYLRATSPIKRAL
jgi:predicted Zn-dependent protease